MKLQNQFNVLNWDINRNQLETYDVLPYFRREYEACPRKPSTKEEWKEFIRKEGKYRYWARCEYEIIISPWPPQKKDVNVKVDVWQQIENNLELIVKLLMEEYDTKN